ncbi:MAG: peptidoglycan-associated lipoprotein Pal [Deltaproteobacteria bacterium]|nr:peptidoglycan-associated lipoprotein Pal [Deltaproteobacteria bacterium]
MLTVACQKRVAVQQQPVVVEEKEEPVAEKKEEPVAAPKETKLDAMVMEEDIHFDFDKYNLTPTAQENLLRKAEWLRANPDVTVTIEGHADERGTNEYNLALGDRRADSAKAFLVNLGIPASRLTTISYGEERPLCTAQNEECWAKNRRGNFVLN